MLSLIFLGFIFVFFSVLLSVQSSVLLSSEWWFCVQFCSMHIHQHFFVIWKKLQSYRTEKCNLRFF